MRIGKIRAVMCSWQLLAASEQPAETGTLRLQRHLQLKQTGVMQDQTLLLFKMETAKRYLARDRRGIMGQSRGGESIFTAKSNGEIKIFL